MKYPWIAVAAIAVMILPVILLGSYKLSFDNLKDMGNDSPSVVGFNTVAEHFSKGTAMPTTVVISNGTPMDNSKDLSVIDGLIEKIKKVKGVGSVMGPTQPQGTQIADLYSDSQVGQVVSGMTTANSGLVKISNGLGTINNKLTTPDFSQVNQLVSGTAQIQTGMQSLTDALGKVNSGISAGASGADEIADGISQIRSSLTTVGGTLDQMYAGYSGLEAGYETFGEHYKTVEQSLSGLAQLAGGMNQIVSATPAYSGLAQQMAQLSGSLSGLDSGFATLNAQFDGTLGSFKQLNGGLEQVSGGISQINAGLATLESGQRALSSGLKQGSGGEATIIANLQRMTGGLAKISQGQQQMAGGLSTLGGSLTQLKNGLAASNDGLKKISGGIVKSNEFLNGLKAAKTFYLPSEVLKSADFKKVLDAYMSNDRKTVKLTVTLTDDPYSDSAIKTVAQISSLLPDTLSGSPLSGAKYATGGETSATNDMHGIATSDMKTTQIIVIAGIFLVLVLIIKSFWIPLYIIGSLLLSFYTSISLTSLFAKLFLHSSEVTWNVPFFGFVMIVALGVDYSIFLMTRFREYRHITPHEGIIKASANVGGVVLSAAIILAGTFATLAPSGINTLLELAVCVCIGIITLSVILLPIVIPSCISVQDHLVKRYSYGQKD
ncbi:MAG: MMPL family transporter [Clostridia bacterium]|nr:MMPL family transporter [Clostridia bacterium]